MLAARCRVPTFPPQRLKCKDCELSFKTHVTLRRHVLRKHTQKRYRCPVCERMYAYLRDAVDHMKQNSHLPLPPIDTALGQKYVEDN